MNKRDQKGSQILSEISKNIYDMEYRLKFPTLSKMVQDKSENKTELYQSVNDWYAMLSVMVIQAASMQYSDVRLKNKSFIYSSCFAKIAGFFTGVIDDKASVLTRDNAVAAKIIRYLANARYFAEYDVTAALELEDVCKHYRQLLDETRYFANVLSDPYKPSDFLHNITSDPFIHMTIEVMSQYVSY